MKVKIHCFEGEWDRKHQELSIRPLLQVLEQSYRAADTELCYTYHFCQTVERLKENLRVDGRRFNTGRHQHCLYFAFHGTGIGLFSADGKEQLYFEEIAQLLGNKVTGSIIFFGSCGAQRTSREELQKLKAATGAALVVGYGAAVDWLTSSTFEMLFFSELHRYKKLGNFINRLEKLISPEQVLFGPLKVILV